MSGPPIDLDDTAAVQGALRDIPLRTRPGCIDVMIMIAGADRLASTLLLIDDVPADLAQHRRVQAFARTWRDLRDQREAVAVAVTVCREGGPDPTGEDLAWHDAIRATAAHAGVSCLGVFVSTPRGVAQVLPTAA
jgi:hypothetical protein